MEFTIGKLAEENLYLHTYAVEVKMMHGDGDAYTTKQIIVPKEKEELLKYAVETLETMKNLPWNGAREKYNELPGFLTWFGMEYLGDDDEDEEPYDENWDVNITWKKWNEIKKYSFDWENDIIYSDINARLDKYQIFYYDGNASKYHVEVKK